MKGEARCSDNGLPRCIAICLRVAIRSKIIKDKLIFYYFPAYIYGTKRVLKDIRMKINAATKIATLLKHHPDALETIVSISPKFEKLRNPLLRRLLAGRTSIAMASRIGGCKVRDFFEQLKPLKFEVEELPPEKSYGAAVLPDFLRNKKEEEMEVLDVRPVLDADRDPLKIILEQLKRLAPGKVLKIVNSFEPSPLIELVKKKGFDSYSKTVHPDLNETYVYPTEMSQGMEWEPEVVCDEWETVLSSYQDKLVRIDVRQLAMPQPMITILEALENLPEGKALFVQHKKVPVFLLPELKDKGFGYSIKEINEEWVQLIIYRALDGD